MQKRGRTILAILLALVLGIYMSPTAFAGAGENHDGVTDGHNGDGAGTGTGHYDGDGHNHGGTGTGTHNGHYIDDGHIHHQVGNGSHFTGDGHNHSKGHAGHEHGSLVRGMNRFMAKGVVVSIEIPDAADTTTTPTMTVNVEHVNHAFKNLVALGEDVVFIIAPNAYVMMAGIGPGVLEEIGPSDFVKVMGNIVNSTDGTTTLYEITKIVVY